VPVDTPSPAKPPTSDFRLAVEATSLPLSVYDFYHHFMSCESRVLEECYRAGAMNFHASRCVPPQPRRGPARRALPRARGLRQKGEGGGGGRDPPARGGRAGGRGGGGGGGRGGGGGGGRRGTAQRHADWLARL